MSKLSVIIPSRTETYLQKTIDDILEKAQDEVQVIVALDGYWPKKFNWTDSRITIIHRGTSTKNKGMRDCINAGMSIARGEYVMKLDEHCMLDKGFDAKLKADCKDDWVVVPRRYRLDADNWKVIEDGRPPIDYMFIEDRGGYLHGTEWKRPERENILIDDLMTFQGSCWFLKKKYWDSTIGLLEDENYGPFANEAQEVSNKVWLSGGSVKVNKKTWYAHWHRKSGWNFTKEERDFFNASIAKGRAYSHDFWINNRWDKRKHDYQWLIDKFSPLPK